MTTAAPSRKGSARVWPRLALPALLLVMAAPTAAQDERRLTVAVPADRPPFSSLTADNALEGHRVDLWRLMAERTGIALRLVPIDRTGGLAMMAQRRADAADLFAQTRVPGHEARVMLPEEEIRYVIFSKQGASGPRRVGVVEGSLCDTELAAREGPAPVRYVSPQSMMFAITTDQLDDFCLSEATGAALLDQADLSGRFSASEPLVTATTGTIFRRGDARVAALLAELSASVDARERMALLEQWHDGQGSQVLGLSPRVTQGILLGLAAVVLALALVAALQLRAFARARRWLQLTRARLARSEERFSTVIAHSSLPIAVMRDRRFHRVNEAASRLLGYDSPARLVGRDALDLSPEVQADGQTSAARLEQIRAQLAREGKARFDWIHLCHDGRPIVVDVLLASLPAEDGVETLAIWTDVTAQRAAEETLRTYSERLEEAVALRTEELAARNAEQRAILDTAPFGIALVRRGRIAEASAQLHHQFRAPPETLPGSPIRDLLPEDEAPPAAAEAVEDRSRFVRRRDGSGFWARIRTAALDPQDRAKGEVWVFDDITAEREAETQLRRAKDLADQTARLKSEFLSTMSHEIRTPLNSLVGFLELLAADRLTDLQASRADKALQAARHLIHIVNDILDLSRAEHGGLVLEAIPVDLADLAREALESIVPSVAGREIELILDLDPQAPRFILGDPLRLTQILTNYLSNAAKFTERGEITLSLTLRPAETGSSLRLAVRDTGLGLSPAQSARIFESFSQADHSIARLYGGTGLGLAICRQLAGLMGATVGVDSARGQGSTFWLDLPLGRELPEPANRMPRDLGRGETILLCLGNASLAQSLGRALEACGFRVGRADRAPLPEAAVVVFDEGCAEASPSIFEAIRQAGRPAVGLFRGDNPRLAGLAAESLRKPVDPFRLAAILRRLARGLPAEARRPVRRGAAAPQLVPGLRILVADDDPMNRELAAARLAGLGITVRTAADGAEAVLAAEAEPFDLILMDHQMPVMDGIEAARRIRALPSRNSQVKIVAISGSDRAEVRAACEAAGMSAFILKPFTTAQLLDLLHELFPAAAPPDGG